ncbi:MAG: hypothetical protein AAFX05_07985 [Planctomycetota bacterium]
MTRSIRRMTLVALTALFLPATAAVAQDDATEPTPRAIVEQCVETLHTLNRETVKILGQTAGGAAERIERLDNIGAPAPVMAGVGERATDATVSIARNALRVADRITADCLQALRDVDAPEEAFERVIAANRNTGERILQAQDRAQRVVRVAVRMALADEFDPAAAIIGPIGAVDAPAAHAPATTTN